MIGVLLFYLDHYCTRNFSNCYLSVYIQVAAADPTTSSYQISPSSNTV